MRVGNETANDQLGIDLALQCVEQVDTFRRLKVPHTTGEWAPAGSELAALLVKLPEGPVDLRLMVHEGLWSAFSCMDEVAQIFRRERGSTEVALMPLLRTALLAASRCIYCLAPGEDREDRAIKALRQEAASLKRFYRDLGDAPQLVDWGYVVTEAERADHLAWIDRVLPAGVRAPGEAQLIAEMTRVSLNEMRQLDWWNEAQEREEKDHLLWIFNVYSGVSHGMSWHELMHRQGSFPGHFITEFYLIALIVDRAHQIALEAAGIDPLD